VDQMPVDVNERPFAGRIPHQVRLPDFVVHRLMGTLMETLMRTIVHIECHVSTGEVPSLPR
jgi:hypothetical protein